MRKPVERVFDLEIARKTFLFHATLSVH